MGILQSVKNAGFKLIEPVNANMISMLKIRLPLNNLMIGLASGDHYAKCNLFIFFHMQIFHFLDRDQITSSSVIQLSFYFPAGLPHF